MAAAIGPASVAGKSGSADIPGILALLPHSSSGRFQQPLPGSGCCRG